MAAAVPADVAEYFEATAILKPKLVAALKTELKCIATGLRCVILQRWRSFLPSLRAYALIDIAHVRRQWQKEKGKRVAGGGQRRPLYHLLRGRRGLQ